MSYDPFKYPSAWTGHFEFAHWLVQAMNPKLVVELGVDYGHSLIELGRFNKGSTHGIDWFQGDSQTGDRNTEEIARQNVRDSEVMGIEIFKSSFSDAVGNYRDQSIDILHVDGCHSFECVRKDVDDWWMKLKWGGVLLLHDTESFPEDVGRFYREILYPKFNFTHSSGLGVITKVKW